MSFKIHLSYFLVLSFIYLSTVVERSNGEEGNSTGVDCKKVIGGIVKEQMVLIKECLKEMTFENGKEKAEKMTCIMVCAMKKGGHFDAEGRQDASASLSFLEEKFPAELKDKVMDIMLGCQEHLGTIEPNASKDPLCKSYDPILKCIQNGFNKICA